MKKMLLISGLLLALTASVASPGGINLAWNNCYAALTPPTLQFACNANTALAGVLYGSFEPNIGQQVTAFDFEIDLQSAGGTLPEWWRFKAAGTCRQASMTMITNFAAGPFDCADPWGGTIYIQDFSYLVGHTGPNSARITGGGAVPLGAPVPVESATEYYCFALTINGAKTVGTDSCAGCLDPVCLVLNKLTLYDEIGAKTILTGPAGRNYVAWQADGFPYACATPTYRATWGRIKSIYR